MNQVKSTKDYKKFKKLLGNRNVTEARINKIIHSINKVGYLSNPIIVNENMEVIDGQGRLAALERLGLPVEYIVQEGVGINECISMNLNQTNWNLMNYILSFSNRGNENYTKLVRLMQEYNDFNLNAIATALFGIGKFSSQVIAKGKLIISDELIEVAKSRMDYVRQLNETLALMKVNKATLRQALIYMTMFEDVDKEGFIEQFKKNGLILKPFHTLNDCILAIEELYNYGRHKKLFIHTMYVKIARENEKRGLERVMQERLKTKKIGEEEEIKSAEELQSALNELAFNMVK